jgi:hypothetical protein
MPLFERNRKGAVIAGSIAILLLALAILGGRAPFGISNRVASVVPGNGSSAHSPQKNPTMTAIFSNGTVTSSIHGYGPDWSFVLASPGQLSGSVKLSLSWGENWSVFDLMNDSNYALFVTNNGSGWTAPTYALYDWLPAQSNQIQVFNFNYALPPGQWHLVFAEALSPPAFLPPHAPSAPVVSLIWTGGLWVNSVGPVVGPITGPPPYPFP